MKSMYRRNLLTGVPILTEEGRILMEKLWRKKLKGKDV